MFGNYADWAEAEDNNLKQAQNRRDFDAIEFDVEKQILFEEKSGVFSLHLKALTSAQGEKIKAILSNNFRAMPSNRQRELTLSGTLLKDLFGSKALLCVGNVFVKKNKGSLSNIELMKLMRAYNNVNLFILGSVTMSQKQLSIYYVDGVGDTNSYEFLRKCDVKCKCSGNMVGVSIRFNPQEFYDKTGLTFFEFRDLNQNFESKYSPLIEECMSEFIVKNEDDINVSATLDLLMQSDFEPDFLMEYALLSTTNKQLSKALKNSFLTKQYSSDLFEQLRQQKHQYTFNDSGKMNVLMSVGQKKDEAVLWNNAADKSDKRYLLNLQKLAKDCCQYAKGYPKYILEGRVKKWRGLSYCTGLTVRTMMFDIYQQCDDKKIRFILDFCFINLMCEALKYRQDGIESFYRGLQEINSPVNPQADEDKAKYVIFQNYLESYVKRFLYGFRSDKTLDFELSVTRYLMLFHYDYQYEKEAFKELFEHEKKAAEKLPSLPENLSAIYRLSNFMFDLMDVLLESKIETKAMLIQILSERRNESADTVQTTLKMVDDLFQGANDEIKEWPRYKKLHQLLNNNANDDAYDREMQLAMRMSLTDPVSTTVTKADDFAAVPLKDDPFERELQLAMQMSLDEKPFAVHQNASGYQALRQVGDDFAAVPFTMAGETSHAGAYNALAETGFGNRVSNTGYAAPQVLTAPEQAAAVPSSSYTSFTQALGGDVQPSAPSATKPAYSAPVYAAPVEVVAAAPEAPKPNGGYALPKPI